jgi:CarD family transcriptional regulator
MAARKKTTKKVSKPTARSSKRVAKAPKPAAKSSKPASPARRAKASAAARVSRAATTRKPASKASKSKNSARARKAEAPVKAAVKAAVAKAARKAAAEKAAAKALAAKAVAKAAATKPAAAKAPEPIVTKKALEAPAKTQATAAPIAPPAKVLERETTVKVSAPATAAPSPVVAKAVKAPAPMKTNERDEQGGEQKTMKNNANRLGFKLNEFVVYPAHGVGQIVALEEQEVAGFRLELFVISFAKDKMTLRVPTSKVTGVGMRKLSDPDAARRSLDILTGRARIKRTMWSRRAQEYEAKINSGDINAIAEVVRDLFRSDAQPEQSYSERQLYEAALDRMMREIAAVQKLSETEALKVIEVQLKKNQKRAAKAETVEGDETDIEEAA